MWSAGRKKSPQARAGATAEMAGLAAVFTEWSVNAAQIEGNFLTSELIPLSKNLSNLGSIGLRALEYLSGGKSAAPDWAAQQRQAIDSMEKPVAEVRLAAIRPVRILLNAMARIAPRSSADGERQ